MLIQCTKKLLDQLNIKPEPHIDEEPLFSWHANLITINRRKAVVLVNDNNRYIIVLYGLKAKDFKKLDEHIIKAIREVLKNEGIKDDVINKFIDHSRGVTYTKTKDKTSVARMNKSCETVYYKPELLNDNTIYQSDISAWTSKQLVGHGSDYIIPNEELYKDLEVFSGKKIFSCRTAVIKAALDLENRNVWRRVTVPLNITFSRFHEVLQAVFGWKDDHLHEFYIYANERSTNKYSRKAYINHTAYIKKGFMPVVNLVCSEEALAYQDEIEMKLEDGIRLSEYIPEYKRIKYIYDFGDCWQHYIEVEKIIEDYDKNYPICMEGEGSTPPEDVGGKYGYEEFLTIIADENDPEYKETLTWAQYQGYKEFDIDMVNRKLGWI